VLAPGAARDSFGHKVVACRRRRALSLRTRRSASLRLLLLRNRSTLARGCAGSADVPAAWRERKAVNAALKRGKQMPRRLSVVVGHGAPGAAAPDDAGAAHVQAVLALRYRCTPLEAFNRAPRARTAARLTAAPGSAHGAEQPSQPLRPPACWERLSRPLAWAERVASWKPTYPRGRDECR
jgi:hypothetical protein